MTDENAGTAPAEGEAQSQDTAPATGTPTPVDEVTTLRSRNAGLDAKVTELSKAQKLADQRAAEAEKKLNEYLTGKVMEDSDLRAQIQAKEDELATARREAQLAKIEAKYPETFSVLGEAAAALTADQLAAAEARFAGVAAPTGTPKPIGNNPPRTQGGASSANTNPEGETLDQLKKRVYAMIPPGRD